VANPTRKFTVVRRADVPRPPEASAGHPMSLAFVESARRVEAVLRGVSLAAAEQQILSPPELRRDVHDLVYGTLRRYGVGDAWLSRLVDREPDGLVRALLLVALYRLESRPDSEHVVVDQAVNAAGELTQRKAGGFVNAVLRNFLRRRHALAAEVAALPEVADAHPRWWIDRLKAAWPAQWQAIVAADNAPPPLSLRVNQRHGSRKAYLERLLAAGIDAREIDGFGSAIRVPEGTRIDLLPGYADGDFSVQDPGAQRAAEWLALSSNMRVLDACAAPGGKACHLMETADVNLLALDIDPARCRRVEENLQRLRLVAKVAVGDAAQPEDWWDGQPFDRILADVPCTASGVVRRHPDVKWLRRDLDVKKFARTQASLLKSLWSLLKPGGKLLYATCSVFPEENHLQVSAFNAAFTDARLLQEEQLLPGPSHDGFYYALLEKPLA